MSDFLVKTPDNYSNFIGKCWSKQSAYFDFFNYRARIGWSNVISGDTDFMRNHNNLYIWNDMNEPSVFDEIELTMPKNNIITYNNRNYQFRSVKNIYGHLMHIASYYGLKARYGLRPFVLTRSFYLGSQKYSAHWNGDMASDFDNLSLSPLMMIQLSISGYSFVGADVGGFANKTNEETLLRWYQIGIFYPFLRSHSHNETRRREPWLYSDIFKQSIRENIQLRYMLLDFMYTTMFFHSITGDPIIKPVWFFQDFSETMNNNNIKNHFYFSHNDKVKYNDLNEDFKNYINQDLGNRLEDISKEISDNQIYNYVFGNTILIKPILDQNQSNQN